MSIHIIDNKDDSFTCSGCNLNKNKNITFYSALELREHLDFHINQGENIDDDYYNTIEELSMEEDVKEFGEDFDVEINEEFYERMEDDIDVYEEV